MRLQRAAGPGRDSAGLGGHEGAEQEGRRAACGRRRARPRCSTHPVQASARHTAAPSPVLPDFHARSCTYEGEGKLEVTGTPSGSGAARAKSGEQRCCRPPCLRSHDKLSSLAQLLPKIVGSCRARHASSNDGHSLQKRSRQHTQRKQRPESRHATDHRVESVATAAPRKGRRKDWRRGTPPTVQLHCPLLSCPPSSFPMSLCFLASLLQGG